VQRAEAEESTRPADARILRNSNGPKKVLTTSGKLEILPPVKSTGRRWSFK
jgi:hypothetical protein